jgi:hypothetical protein
LPAGGRHAKNLQRGHYLMLQLIQAFFWLAFAAIIIAGAMGYGR